MPDIESGSIRGMEVYWIGRKQFPDFVNPSW